MGRIFKQGTNNEKIFCQLSRITIFAVPKNRVVLIIKVRCLRGRKDQFAKLTYGKLYRGFESLPHRKPAKYPANAGYFCY